MALHLSRSRLIPIVIFFLVVLASLYEKPQISSAVSNLADVIEKLKANSPPPLTSSETLETPSPSTTDEEVKSLDNLLRTEAQCLADFPGLYDSIDKSVTHYMGHPLQRADLEQVFVERDFTWVIIRNNQLYVRSRHGGFQSRVSAVLADLNRAIITSPERLPNIEFIFGTADSAPSEKYTPIFGLSRGLEERAFLISDFGYWAWPEPYVNGFTNFENQVEKLERQMPFRDKKEQLFWRGNVDMHEERKHLVEISAKYNETWGNVRHIDWGNLGDDDRYDMADHCRFQFVAHVEGVRYSARLKYLQHCNSVIVTHTPSWTTPLSHLLRTKGEDQNIVVVGKDFTKVDQVMNDLLKNKAKAERIARNNQETFGQKYGRLDAEICYWRQLIRGYHSIMAPEFQRSVSTEGFKDYESVSLMGGTEWAIA